MRQLPGSAVQSARSLISIYETAADQMTSQNAGPVFPSTYATGWSQKYLLVVLHGRLWYVFHLGPKSSFQMKSAEYENPLNSSCIACESTAAMI